MLSCLWCILLQTIIQMLSLYTSSLLFLLSFQSYLIVPFEE